MRRDVIAVRNYDGAGVHMDSGRQISDIKQMLARRDLRSADRANMNSMLRRLNKSEALSYQERQNLWAYVKRYSPAEVNNQL
ncbi:MAG: hypothetical protein ACR2GA_01775 [Chloroflexota bacterium]